MFYFAYGSNMDEDQMLDRCGEKNFRRLGRAVLRDYTLKFNKRCRYGACANVERREGEYVEGILYHVNEQCLKKLDQYETNYRKIAVHVEFEEKRVKAFTYIARVDSIEEGLKPAEEYLKRVLKPCREKILNDEYCRKIKEAAEV